MKGLSKIMNEYQGKEDYLVEMYKYAALNLQRGCTLPEMISHLESIGIAANEQPLNASARQAFGQIFVDSYRANIGYTDSEEARYWMQSEAYFRYLGYIEMKEARTNASQASKLAITAICVSAVLALIQIIIALK